MFILGCLLGVTLSLSIIMAIALRRYDSEKKSIPPGKCSISGNCGKLVIDGSSRDVMTPFFALLRSPLKKLAAIGNAQKESSTTV